MLRNYTKNIFKKEWAGKNSFWGKSQPTECRSVSISNCRTLGIDRKFDFSHKDEPAKIKWKIDLSVHQMQTPYSTFNEKKANKENTSGKPIHLEYAVLQLRYYWYYWKVQVYEKSKDLKLLHKNKDSFILNIKTEGSKETLEKFEDDPNFSELSIFIMLRHPVDPKLRDKLKVDALLLIELDTFRAFRWKSYSFLWAGKGIGK